MFIAIPSRSRAETIGGMISRIPPDYRQHTRVFVPASQRERYDRNLRNTGAEMITLSDDYRMADVRWFMGNYATKVAAAPYFLMIDDDVRFERRVSEAATNTTTCTLEETAECFRMIEHYLKDGRWGMIGLQARQFQNSNPPCGKEAIKEITRNMCVTGWRAEDFARVDYRRCVVRSDFDATIQLLRLGRPNANLIYWQHSQVNNKTGGCADYRTTEIADAAAQALKELHPNYVTLVQKHYEAQSRRKKLNMGDRIEVQIAWRRAYNDGLRNNQQAAA